jgi:hypothetical protein
MVETNELKLGIGNEEAVTLKPTRVKIISLSVEEVGVKKSKKVICLCKHPDNEEPIKISSVKYENKGKLEVSGLWVNKDSKGLIRKGSALAIFLQNQGASIIEQLAGKEVSTATDDKGYLTFKAY